MQLVIHGLEELRRKLLALPSRVQRVALIKAVKAGAQPILNAARSRVPKKTGLLARSIKVSFVQRGVNRVQADVGVFAAKRRKGSGARVLARAAKAGRTASARDFGDPFYARFVERGTAKMAARPFLRPALDENAQRAVDAVGRVLREEIERVGQS